MIIFYELNKSETAEFLHLSSEFSKIKGKPIDRTMAMLNDHVIRISSGIITPKIQIMIDRDGIVSDKYLDYLTNRNRDIDLVTEDVNAYDAKFSTLSPFLKKMERKIRTATDDDETIVELLYFNNKTAFRKGSQGDQLIFLDSWLKLMATKPIIALAMAEATLWVEDLKLKAKTKGTEKGTVREDRSLVDEIVHEAYGVMRQDFGDLISINFNDLRGVINSFNAKLLKPNQTDKTKLKPNQIALNIIAGTIASNFEKIFPIGGSIMVGNPNNSAVKIFFSEVTPTSVAEYSITVPPNSKLKIVNKKIRIGNAKMINAAFVNPALNGTIIININKTR
ncbi:MAG: hypothetical protein WCL51_12525 [Bacteroidota bacterium]